MKNLLTAWAPAPAVGTITILGEPNDGDYVTVSDAGASVEFEFDSDSDVEAGRTAVAFTAAVAAVHATGSVTLAGQPADGDTITIDDGPTTKVFEFDNNGSVTGGNVQVPIGSTVMKTLESLAEVIGYTADFTVDPVYPVGSSVLSLRNATAGAAGNVTITKVGTNITVAGMSGGAAATTGSTPTEIAAALAAAIEAETGIADALSATSDGAVVTVTYDTNTPAGNNPITKSASASNVTVAGMVGGTANPSDMTEMFLLRANRRAMVSITQSATGNWAGDLQGRVTTTEDWVSLLAFTAGQEKLEEKALTPYVRVLTTAGSTGTLSVSLGFLPNRY